MKNKYFQAIEILWLVTTILCIATGIHQTIYESLHKSYPFFIFAVLALLMYLFRRKTRLKKTSGKE